MHTCSKLRFLMPFHSDIVLMIPGVELPVGTKIEGVVLYVDAVNKRLVMSTDRDLVRDVSRRIEKPTMDKVSSR